MPQAKLVISEANYTKTLLYSLSFNGKKEAERLIKFSQPKNIKAGTCLQNLPLCLRILSSGVWSAIIGATQLSEGLVTLRNYDRFLMLTFSHLDLFGVAMLGISL